MTLHIDDLFRKSLQKCHFEIITLLLSKIKLRMV